MPITSPPRTLRTMALDCVQRVLRDYLTDRHYPAGLSSEAEAARYAAVQTWARTGREIAAGEWSDQRMAEFVQHCLRTFDPLEDMLAV